MNSLDQFFSASQPIHPDQSDSLKLTFVDTLRQDFNSALSSIEKDVRTLVQDGQEAAALQLFSKQIARIVEIRETLSTFYTMFYQNASVLKRYGSERLKQVGAELLPIYDVLKDADASKEEIEQHLLKNFRAQGISITHWWMKEVIVVEIQYMLDTLKILIEPQFLPIFDSAEDKSDRYISPDVKLAVWRRDEGKCVQCGSKEKLEYDHIIPIAKGGSNTERNVQLLCQKCNREKSARIS